MNINKITEMMQMMKDARKANAGNLTIDEMLSKLNLFGDDEKLIFSNGSFLDGDFGSYRGYYEDLYIGFDDEDKGLNTVGKLKEILNNALSAGEMYGYKGGEYKIIENTLVWLSTYGDTGEMIIDIQNVNGDIFIIVKEDN